MRWFLQREEALALEEGKRLDQVIAGEISSGCEDGAVGKRVDDVGGAALGASPACTQAVCQQLRASNGEGLERGLS